MSTDVESSCSDETSREKFLSLVNALRVSSNFCLKCIQFLYGIGRARMVKTAGFRLGCRAISLETNVHGWIFVESGHCGTWWRCLPNMQDKFHYQGLHVLFFYLSEKRRSIEAKFNEQNESTLIEPKRTNQHTHIIANLFTLFVAQC